jgi:hypothetical protein
MQPHSIQSLGGKARDKALTAEQKSEIGKKAAETRWANRPLQAFKKGNFKEEFGIDVDCYVLDDAQKTAVISQSGMGRALGLSVRGNAFPRFLESRAMSNIVGAELREKIAQPLKFEWGTGGAEQPPGVIHGFDVTLLIDICRFIIQADTEGRLGKRHERVVGQAQVILNASAKSGIKGLVYALAGYNPTAEEVIKAFKLYVQEEARKYEKEFPPELYQAWYRLYQIPPIQGRGRPWHFKKLTVEHIYAPLARSNGSILELMRALKAKEGDRRKKLLQFLSEVGVRALRMHLGRVLEMAEDSPDQTTYEKRIAKRFGLQQELDFDSDGVD